MLNMESVFRVDVADAHAQRFFTEVSLRTRVHDLAVVVYTVEHARRSRRSCPRRCRATTPPTFTTDRMTRPPVVFEQVEHALAQNASSA